MTLNARDQRLTEHELKLRVGGLADSADSISQLRRRNYRVSNRSSEQQQQQRQRQQKH